MMRRLTILLALLLAVTMHAHCKSNADAMHRQLLPDTLVVRNVRLPWKHIGVSLAARIAMKAAIDMTMKHYIHELRPDGSDWHSMPSRHSTWAYGFATSFTYRLGERSPWWATGMHAAAAGVGLQRVMASRHYPGDVMAGAGIGISTSILSFKIADWILGSDHTFAGWRSCTNDAMPSITVTSGAVFPIARNFGDLLLGTSLVSDVRFALPFDGGFSFTAAASLSSTPVKVGRHYQALADASYPAGSFLSPLNRIGVAVGADWHRCIADGPFAVAFGAEAGYRFNLSARHLAPGTGSLTAALRGEASVMLTDRLAVGAQAVYDVSTLRLQSRRIPSAQPPVDGDTRTLPAIGVAFFTRACF